jgi:hypothetical protein
MLAKSLETGFIPYDFVEEPKVTVSYTKTLVGWYNVYLPHCKRPLFTLSPDAAQSIGIDGCFSLGCVMADTDAVYDLFVRRWIDNDPEVFVHLTKFDLVAWYAVEGEKLDEAEEYRQLISDVIGVWERGVSA